MNLLPAHLDTRTALSLDGRSLNYRELSERVQRLAAALHAHGVRAGDRVAILALNHFAHIELMLAAARLGFIHVPLNHRLSVTELRALLAPLAPSLLLVDAEHEALVAELELPRLRLSDYEAWLAAAVPGSAPDWHATGDDIHMILHTGGTTGQAKGACLPYRQTLGNADDTVAVWGLREADVAIQCTPCFHAAVNVLSLPLLRVGGHVVLMPRFDAEDYLRLAAHHGASLLFMVPTMFQMLAESPGFARWNSSRLRWAVTGGAPCPETVAAPFRARGIGFHRGFGMTEAGVNCFALDQSAALLQPDTVGRPMPQIRSSVRCSDGSEAAVDEVGELWLSGPQLFAGYWGQTPIKSGEWFATGDLASRDADGLHRIRGRLKDLYISGGEKVHPVEVEAALMRQPGIAECCVFGWPHPRWGECGIALVVARPGAQLLPEVLREALRGELAGYKLPAEIRIVDSLAKSAAGKLLRNEARAAYAAGRGIGAAA